MPEATLLFLHALTAIHPGGGTALGVVDLPVQRERHTQWPMIAGSSLKGVLRDACRRSLGDGKEGKALLHAAFGPETSNASDFAGALAFTDARLLAFPRSFSSGRVRLGDLSGGVGSLRAGCEAPRRE